MIRQPYENNDIVPQDSRGTSNSNALSAEPYLSRIAHDYAEEIQAELLTLMQEHESLRRSEELFRDFFENSKEAIYSHDLSGRYLMVNRAGEDLLGYSREELLQKTVFDLTPACYFAQVGQNLKQKLADHAP
ncbi:MAG TPA: PAS domain S-box protein, partial [Pyrinomonadaceae bacterium]